MRMMTKILAGAAGIAAVAAAAPASAQYYAGTQYGYAQPFGYAQQPYGYAQRYGYSGYNGYAVNNGFAQQQCTAAVQNRLYNRTSLGSILGSLVSVPVSSRGQVLGITSQTQTRYGTMRIKGIASSGRYAANNYSPYGVGAYGALGYGNSAAADLSFTCDVDMSGNISRLNINRR